MTALAALQLQAHNARKRPGKVSHDTLHQLGGHYHHISDLPDDLRAEFLIFFMYRIENSHHIK